MATLMDVIRALYSGSVSKLMRKHNVRTAAAVQKAAQATQATEEVSQEGILAGLAASIVANVTLPLMLGGVNRADSVAESARCPNVAGTLCLATGEAIVTHYPMGADGREKAEHAFSLAPCDWSTEDFVSLLADGFNRAIANRTIQTKPTNAAKGWQHDNMEVLEEALGHVWDNPQGAKNDRRVPNIETQEQRAQRIVFGTDAGPYRGTRKELADLVAKVGKAPAEKQEQFKAALEAALEVVRQQDALAAASVVRFEL